MRFAFLALGLLITLVGQSQWQELSYGDNANLANNHNDLYFTSNDTGYIVGAEFIDPDIHSYVLRTFDGGIQWDTTFFQNKIFRTVHFASIDTGYIAFREGTYLGILRTINGGDDWITVSDSIVQVTPVSLEMTFFDNNRGVMAVPGAAYLTIDAGNSWEVISNFSAGNSGTINSSGNNFVSTGGVIFVYSSDACENISSLVITDNSSGIDIEALGDLVTISFLGQEGGIINSYPFFNFSRLAFGNIDNLDFSFIDLPLIRSINDIEIASESVQYGLTWPNQIDGPRVIKSIDSGLTWFAQGLEDGFDFHYGFHNNLQCLNDTVCYIAHASVIYKTTNGGGPLLEPIESIVLNVENPVSRLEFNIFPNPSRGIITLEFENPIQRLTVFDALGKLVYQENTQYQTQVQLNLRHLPKGLYLVQVEGDGVVGSRKVVLE
jgi:photosystem II stability/assembly factor-like uncharacterized protein